MAQCLRINAVLSEACSQFATLMAGGLQLPPTQAPGTLTLSSRLEGHLHQMQYPHIYVHE